MIIGDPCKARDRNIFVSENDNSNAVNTTFSALWRCKVLLKDSELHSSDSVATSSLPEICGRGVMSVHSGVP